MRLLKNDVLVLKNENKYLLVYKDITMHKTGHINNKTSNL
jgi:hypothetical protein